MPKAFMDDVGIMERATEKPKVLDIISLIIYIVLKKFS